MYVELLMMASTKTKHVVLTFTFNRQCTECNIKRMKVTTLVLIIKILFYLHAVMVSL